MRVREDSTLSLLQEYHGLKRLDTQFDAPRFEMFQAKVAGGTESDMRHCPCAWNAKDFRRVMSVRRPTRRLPCIRISSLLFSACFSISFWLANGFLVNCKSVLGASLYRLSFPNTLPFPKQSSVVPPFSSNSTKLFSVHYEGTRLLSGHSRRAFSNWSVCNLTGSTIVISKRY